MYVQNQFFFFVSSNDLFSRRRKKKLNRILREKNCNKKISEKYRVPCLRHFVTFLVSTLKNVVRRDVWKTSRPSKRSFIIAIVVLSFYFGFRGQQRMYWFFSDIFFICLVFRVVIFRTSLVPNHTFTFWYVKRCTVGPSYSRLVERIIFF